MNNRYSNLKQLIDLWEEYEDNSVQTSLRDFAGWLNGKVEEKPVKNEKAAYVRLSNPPALYVQTLNNFDDNTLFLEYISRIARFHEFYTRKFLEGLPINSRLEFQFLQTVHILQQAKKTDLINLLLVEYTTGMDIIKRLINNGLFVETQNENDKRVKLLELTGDGKKLLSVAEKRLKEERNMFLECISMNKWKKTMPYLQELAEFHNSIYIHHNNKPYSELLNLMDSLKHLYR
ncbi:MAG: MarR family winged helix-turn-helix transcriptional regulator [Methylococcaceae bacterium]|nr:MarR family winged helix-turn-helix transcriptional regulator [Prolixibacteraceae bacterium]